MAISLVWSQDLLSIFFWQLITSVIAGLVLYIKTMSTVWTNTSVVPLLCIVVPWSWLMTLYLQQYCMVHQLLQHTSGSLVASGCGSGSTGYEADTESHRLRWWLVIHSPRRWLDHGLAWLTWSTYCTLSLAVGDWWAIDY